MNKPTCSQHLALYFGLIPMLISAPTFAEQNDIVTLQNGHAIVKDVVKPDAQIKFNEDQDEVYRAVQMAISDHFPISMRLSRKTYMVVLLG